MPVRSIHTFCETWDKRVKGVYVLGNINNVIVSVMAEVLKVCEWETELYL